MSHKVSVILNILASHFLTGEQMKREVLVATFLGEDYIIGVKYVKEDEDNTDLSGEVACAGGQCEVDFSYANSVDTKSQDPQ